MAHRFVLKPRGTATTVAAPVNEEVARSAPSVPARVTPAMVSEAADAVLETVEPQHADVVRRLWVNDSQTQVARLLFQSEITERAKSNFVNWNKSVLRLDETLDPEQTARCSAYVPELQLVFRNSVKHDHPMFSATRRIDHHMLLAKFPSGMRYGDIGGNVMFHVMRGDKECIVIAPDADDKDPQRRMLSDLRLKRIVDGGEADVKGDIVSTAVREIAASVLADEGKFVVRAKAEDAKGVRVQVTMSCHVYDIAMAKWPHIMENIGSKVHEGCVHYSNMFFEQDAGVLEFSGARYTIDKARDEFRMGLGSSMANWYVHKWSEYMKYGANQILRGRKYVYSYQVTERRGDTLFFRIMQIDQRAMPDKRQYYRLPSVEKVEVHGFAVGQRRRASTVSDSLVPRTYVFPARLWNTMLSYAKMELVRGGLDYNKMFNFYRTAVPRQSINSVTVSGGEKVDMDEAPALIVMAAAVAAADVVVLQQSAEAITGEIAFRRDAAAELTMLKLLNTLFDVVKGLGFLAVSPFAWLGVVLENRYLDRAKASLVSWRPQVSIKRFPYSVVADVSGLAYDYLPPRQDGYGGYMLGKPVGQLMNVIEDDPSTARDILDVCGSSLPAVVVARLKAKAATAPDAPEESKVLVAPSVAALPASSSDNGVSEAPTYISTLSEDLVKQRRANRRNAIKEAIVESELEGKKLQAACSLWYRRLFNGGKPNKRALREYAEEMGNPDIWYIENGVLVSSELGQKPEDFQHSGVYTSVPDLLTGSHLRVVMDDTWSGVDRATGEHVTRQHHFIRQSSYSGYALAIDELTVFNGPEIRETLNKALALPDTAFDAKVVVHQGPPGCGKTTSIVNRFALGSDIVLCPARSSLRDTREKLSQRMPELTQKMLRSVSRTTDSLLVNWERIKDKSFDVILGDECYLTHSGKWYACIALLGVREYHGYGDKEQLRHVARVDSPQARMAIVPDVTEETWFVYRGAAEIVAMWNGVYNERVRTKVKFHGKVERVRDHRSVTLEPNGKFLLLTMYQADKKTVQTLFPKVDKAKIMTTHEAQGRDADQVILFNFELRVRTAEDKFYLFCKQAYCNVALSRARRHFVYVKQANTPDLVTEWVERAQDSRRVALAREVSTAGVSKPFI